MDIITGGGPEGFHINTVNLPHDLALQLKHLFWNPALLLPAYFSCSAAAAMIGFLALSSSFQRYGHFLSFQMGQVWNELQPKLGCLFGSNNGLKSDL